MKGTGSSSRRRAKRPRFVSLRRQLSTEKAASPEAHEENVAERFFAGAEEEEGCGNSLRGLLDEEATGELESPVSSVSAAYDAEQLVRAAMRSSCSRREEEEEVRWVRMSEVQLQLQGMSDEASSCTRALALNLNLKLDYKEVEDAWDKGTPFFDSESQIVPDLALNNHNNNNLNGALWGVPDEKSCSHKHKHKHGMEGHGEQSISIEGWRLGQREASVLRYKEKRMNRLFSKRIRYQVRKLNAEKRPRVKGRFVKRG